MSCGIVTRADVVKWLAHHFQHVALKLRQFIKKQHALVTQRTSTRARVRPSANQARIANGVVRRTKRPRAYKSLSTFKCSRDAMNARGFNRFLERHGRQNGWEALCQHRFAGSRRTNEQNIVAARTRNFQGPLRCLLSMNI